MANRQRRSRGGEPHEPRRGFGIAELLKGVGNLVELLQEMEQAGKSELSQVREFKGPGELRGIYGFTVRTGLGGLPTVERFGNVRESPAGPVVSEEREPLVDVFDEEDTVVVVAELPGATEGSIDLDVRGKTLSLRARGPNCRYAREVDLPVEVDPHSLERSYHNGVLEVRLRKAKGGEASGQ